MAVQVNQKIVKTTVRLNKKHLSLLQGKVKSMYGKLKGTQESVLQDAVKLWLGKFADLEVYAGVVILEGESAVNVVVTPEELSALLRSENYTWIQLEPVSKSPSSPRPVSQRAVEEFLSFQGESTQVWGRRGDSFNLLKASSINVTNLLISEEGEEAAEYEQISFVWGGGNREGLAAILEADAVLTLTPYAISFSRPGREG